MENTKNKTDAPNNNNDNDVMCENIAGLVNIVQRDGSVFAVSNVNNDEWRVKGICLDRSRGYNKFKAYVDVFGVRVNLGAAFPSASEALAARDRFISKIFTSSYGPLPSFLCDRFGLSMNRCYAALALAVPLYLDLPAPQHSMFPNFVVKSLRNPETLNSIRNLSDTQVEMLKAALFSLPPSALAVALGRMSFSQARRYFGCRYEDILDELSSLAAAVAGVETRQN